MTMVWEWIPSARRGLRLTYRSGRPISSASSRILIVDDGEANVRLLEAVLQTAGATHVEALLDPLCRRAVPRRPARHPAARPAHARARRLRRAGAAPRAPSGRRVPAGRGARPPHVDAVGTRARHAGQGRTSSTKPFDRMEVLLRVSNLLETRRCTAGSNSAVRSCNRSSTAPSARVPARMERDAANAANRRRAPSRWIAHRLPTHRRARRRRDPRGTKRCRASPARRIAHPTSGSRRRLVPAWRDHRTDRHRPVSKLVPGSDTAMKVKQTLISKGVWSQYLEVGIGPDAEIFTKCQADVVGRFRRRRRHPGQQRVEQPRAQVALVVTSGGDIIGATLGNYVSLRDVKGRSALLLGKAKDNNASASLGPFIRLFDWDHSPSPTSRRRRSR